MGQVQTFRVFARYNNWMNEKVYDATDRLSDADRKQDRAAFFGSIHGTLDHILAGDLIWLERFQVSNAPSLSDLPVSLINPYKGHGVHLYQDFAKLRAMRDSVDEAITRWCEEDLTEEWLGETLVFLTKSAPQIERQLRAGLCVSHFFNHQTHHRGQVTTLFSQCGIDPGITDMMAMPGAA